MNFKKSSMPMIIVAMTCILLGTGLIILCVLLPSEDDSVLKDGDVSDVRKDMEPQNVLDAPTDGQIDNNIIAEPGDNSSISKGPDSAGSDLSSDAPSETKTPVVSSKDDPLLVLANVDNPLPEDFEVGSLEQVQGNYYLDSRAASYAREMISDAKEEGITLQLCSAYRARDLQQTLFTNKYNYYIQHGWEEDDAYAKTATIIAIPGTSEHQTGLCMDVVTPSYQVLDAGYAETDAAKWLYDNAYEYGFILRYPKDKQDITKIIFEPWHYRFVGIENAKLIKDSGLCLEEYLATLE